MPLAQVYQAFFYMHLHLGQMQQIPQCWSLSHINLIRVSHLPLLFHLDNLPYQVLWVSVFNFQKRYFLFFFYLWASSHLKCIFHKASFGFTNNAIYFLFCWLVSVLNAGLFLYLKQLFKRLTQQVRDVNQCMNQQRIYSFKVTVTEY